MASSPPDPQPAAARRAAEAELRRLVAAYAPAHHRLVAAVRRTLRKRLPAAHEVIYEYRDFVVVSVSPNGNGYDGVFALRADADGVKLYFNRGKGLSDPAKLLRGKAGLVRWMAVDGAATLARPDVVRLIEDALARSPLPFEETGRGSVAVRPTAASKRGKR